jgi:hypothetical protein
VADRLARRAEGVVELGASSSWIRNSRWKLAFGLSSVKEPKATTEAPPGAGFTVRGRSGVGSDNTAAPASQCGRRRIRLPNRAVLGPGKRFAGSPEG